jgi:hypothetical protein
MTAKNPPPIPPGHFPEDYPIRFRVLEKRLDDLARDKLLPLRIVCDLAADLGRHRRLTVETIENALEAKITASGEGIPAEHWAKACEMLCPELYGEPPEPPRASEKLPRTRAMLAALMRRFEAGRQLFNPKDTHGVPMDRLEPEMFSPSMQRIADAALAARVYEYRRANPQCSMSEIGKLFGIKSNLVRGACRRHKNSLENQPAPEIQPTRPIIRIDMQEDVEDGWRLELA